ncbi:MAG: tetratricopeptide repeat protein [Phycisphaerales bacterium]|nr:tetratricopeptide repeat protein [Phycisphaerales bacterium]
MLGGKRLLVALSLACLAAPLMAADPVDPSQAATERAKKLLAHRLSTDAIIRSRMATSPGVADEATILIQTAATLDPDNTRLLRLLAESVRVSSLPNKLDIERDALRNVIRLDTGDLVAQVNYFDLVAGATQALDQRARIYRGALDSTSLDPQVRSEMAVRLSKIAAERGDLDSAKGFITQALQHNDVNVSALTAAIALADPTPQARLQAIVALLAANPLQPEAWVGAAAALSIGGAHERAADCLVIAIDQWNVAGRQLPAEVVQTAGQELAIAGRPAMAQPYLMMVAKAKDAPLSALVAARVLATEYAPIAARPDDPTPAAVIGELETQIRARLQQVVSADPKNATPFAEAAWVELSSMPTISADTAKWIDAYAALVPAGDPTLARLKAWQLLRDGKLAESLAIMEKLTTSGEGGGDPLAQLGLARIYLQQDNRDAAAKQLQQLWNNQPTGLLAMQITQLARSVRITLIDPPGVRQLIQTISSLPENALTMHRNPRSIALIGGSFTQRSYNQGEPVLFNARITNTSGRTVPVGPNGLIKTNVAITANSRGVGAQNLGLISIENLQRTYRLHRGAHAETQIRIDQGPLADRLQSNPLSLITVAVSFLSNPQSDGNRMSMGLGGQQVTVGTFDRSGAGLPIGLPSIPTITQIAQNAPGMTVDKQMMLLDVFLRLLDGFSEKQAELAPDESRKMILDVRATMFGTIKDFIGSSSPEVRAWAVRVVPTQGMPQDILDRIARLETDPNPVVRMMWGIRQVMLSAESDEARTRAADALEKHATTETDPVLHYWFVTVARNTRAAKQ